MRKILNILDSETFKYIFDNMPLKKKFLEYLKLILFSLFKLDVNLRYNLILYFTMLQIETIFIVSTKPPFSIIVIFYYQVYISERSSKSFALELLYSSKTVRRIKSIIQTPSRKFRHSLHQKGQVTNHEDKWRRKRSDKNLIRKSVPSN